MGRTIQYVNVPPQVWEAKLQEAQLPAHLTAHLVTMAQLYRDNRYERMTDTFQQLVGRAPISATRIRTPPRGRVHARLTLSLTDALTAAELYNRNAVQSEDHGRVAEKGQAESFTTILD